MRDAYPFTSSRRSNREASEMMTAAACEQGEINPCFKLGGIAWQAQPHTDPLFYLQVLCGF